MRPAVVSILLGIALCSSSLSGLAKPLTNPDVVKMVKAELPDSTIVLAIQNSPPDFDLSPDALIELKSAGVSAKVIEVMLAPRVPPQSTVADSVAPLIPTASEDEVKAALGMMAEVQSEGIISLVAFKKTNGQSAIRDGVPVYTMDFEATVRFSADCIWRNINLSETLRSRLRSASAPKAMAGQLGTICSM